MKRKIISILALVVVVTGTIFLTGCKDTEVTQPDVMVPTVNESSEVLDEIQNAETEVEIDNVKAGLLAVMSGEKAFVDEQNQEVLINDFNLPSEEAIKVKEYAFVDFDKDGNEELIILTDSNYGAYIVFHYEDANIYGYVINIRSLENLKVDGSFSGNSGIGATTYFKMEFDKNTYEMIEVAKNFENDAEYVISGEKVTKELIDTFVADWNEKENLVFEK